MILRGFTVYDIMGTDNPGVISLNNLTCTAVIQKSCETLPHSLHEMNLETSQNLTIILGSRNNYLQDYSSWNLISTCFDIQLFNFD